MCKCCDCALETVPNTGQYKELVWYVKNRGETGDVGLTLTKPEISK